jgi:2-polyprenyl-3-methyl-5-hydroxy-6-metoxy-1,4-benzoquinol methylase
MQNEKITERAHCLVCRGFGFSVLYSATDNLVSRESFTIKKCDECGFVFTSDPPDEKSIAEYYISDDYISHTDSRRSITDRVYHLARNFMLRRKHNLVLRTNGGKTGNLLDIGSGTGYFAAYMKSKGWSASGIEISQSAREYSISKFGINVLDPAGISGIHDESVDCVTLWHVLEHLYNPDYWMTEIKRILKNSGQCLIALPNINSTDSAWFGPEWAALDVPRHLWHFSPETFKKYIHNHGFECTYSEAMPLDIYYISILSCRNRRWRLPLLQGIITGFMLSLRNVFRSEGASSMIYVLSRQSC